MRSRRMASHLPRDLQATEVGHHEVDHQYIGLEDLDELAGLKPGSGLGYYAKILLPLQEQPQTLAENVTITCNDNGHAHGVCF
jgi:hypothetical protein